MSILDRLNLLIRSELNEISSRDRFRSTMSDVESSLRDARRQQIELRKGERQLIEEIKSSRQKVDLWEQRAVLALKAGEEDLAREALVQKNKTLSTIEKLRDQLDDQRAYLKDITRALEALELKLQGTRMQSDRRSTPSTSEQPLNDESAWDRELKRRLAAKGGDVPEMDSSDPSSVSPGNERTFNEFDRMADKIRGFEASIEAFQELSVDDIVDPRRKELENVFNRMERQKKTNDDLEDLKKKFGG